MILQVIIQVGVGINRDGDWAVREQSRLDVVLGLQDGVGRRHLGGDGLGIIRTSTILCGEITANISTINIDETCMTNCVSLNTVVAALQG